MIIIKFDAKVSVVLGALEKFCTDRGEGRKIPTPLAFAILLKIDEIIDRDFMYVYVKIRNKLKRIKCFRAFK